ncbi:ABC transporter permease [Paenibacillus humicola]|uniref:ABC transporter permease n=1 Tax=Paenibacillus humicola TaxID=3110540 RepID=UPI00237C2B44|nr:ABC transporter permease subunit [Paenibacillus humicola]
MSVYIALTGKEWLRKRVLYAAVVLTALFLGLYGFGVNAAVSSFQVSAAARLTDQIILLFLGLFFAQIISAFVVLFACMGTVSGEQESGVLLAILARPQPRWKIYAAKWLGHAVWLLLYTTVLFAAVTAIIGIYGGFPFEATMVLKGWALFEAIPLLLLTATMLGSVYMPTLGNGILVALVYGFAMFGGLLQGLPIAKTQSAIEKTVLLISMVMPTDSVFHRCMYELIGGDSLPMAASNEFGPFSLAFVPSNAFLLYAACYAALLLLLGCRAFGRKDI